MNKPLCVVFSDAFAFRTYQSLGGLGDDYSLKKIIPGIGYSSNLHYLLFDGKTPDELGFFTDYTWETANARSINKLHRICDNVETVNNLYRALTRKITKNKDNIPFSEKAFFHQTGKYKFMSENPTSVFGKQVDMAYEGNNMNACFDKAEQYVSDGSEGIVVVLEELDHLGHEVGSFGKRYVDSAKVILARTRTLFDEFLQKHSDALCVLISDHGMSDVYAGVNVYEGIKRTFGLPGKEYQMYMDSVYLRLWSDDSALLERIGEYIRGIDTLVEIDSNERIRCGVTNRSCGDLIFRLREGYVFQPNSFGVSLKGGCKGIHGFMEATDSASGILVTNCFINENAVIDAYEVYNTVKSLL